MESPPPPPPQAEQAQSPPQDADAAPEPVSGSPSAFLRNIVGKKVIVRIGSGIDYHGGYRRLERSAADRGYKAT